MNPTPPAGRYPLPLPLPVRRAPYETEASVIAALLTRNRYPEHLHARVIREIFRQLAGDGDPRSPVDALLGESDTEQREYERGATTHVSDCAKCREGLGERWACQRCMRGRAARQVPHLDRFVCPKHRLWIGPGAKPSDQQRVTAAVLRADRRAQRMLQAGSIDAPVLLELDQIVERWAELNGQPFTAPERFVVSVRMWSRAHSMLDSITDPFVPFQESYQRLHEAIERKPSPLEQPAPLIDGVWAIVRVAALRRWEIASGAAPVIQDAPHWLQRLPTACRAPIYPVQPFNRYNSAYRTSQRSRWDTENQHLILARRRAGIRWEIPDSSTETMDIACPRGHRTTIAGNNRRRTYTSRNHGCGVCHGRQAKGGFNSLADLNRATAERWHPTRNGDLAPQGVTPGSAQHVWWQCRRGHEFEAVVANMTRSNGAACPICARRRVLIGETGLDITHPHLLVRWHPTLNGALGPAEVLSGSQVVVWWRCPRGHVYDSAVCLVVAGHGCGVCRGTRATPGVNTLADLRPDLAAQWHPTLNGLQEASSVTVSSGKRVWWVCPKGHEWQAHVYKRSQQGCPVCVNLSVRLGVNALSDTHPNLAAEWHPTKNLPATPDTVVAGSPKRYWWVCPLGHEYGQSNVRRRNGSTCPICSNRRVLPGFNDALTRFPDLMRDWDYGRNTDFVPSTRLPGGTKHYWRCFHGHLKHSTIPNRKLTQGCPVCSRSDRVAVENGQR